MSTLAVPEMLQDVRKHGKFDVSGCFNCGSCTIVCDLSNGQASFPRRPMQLAVLGLKEPLVASLEPWLCYDCGDCSISCPREAEPRESMMTLRRYLAAQYDPTGLTSKLSRSKAWKMGAISLVGVLVLFLALVYHTYYVELALSDLVSIAMGMEHMFPMIEVFTQVVYLIPVFFLIVAAFRMYRFTMSKKRNTKIPLRFYFTEAKAMIVHLLFQKNMKNCSSETHKNRWLKHFLLVLGFALISVILFFFLEWFQTDNIYPIYHPQRWLGYFVTVVMIIVPVDIFIGRIKKREPLHKFSELSDLTLPILLFLTAVSGIAVHILRYMELSLACHFTYAIHLAIAVPLVVIEIPFGKLSHLIYRPLAMYFQAVKERAMAEEKPVDVPLPKEAIPA